MDKYTRSLRRVGQTGQFDRQARSHDAPDCGSYRLVKSLGAGRWIVERTAECDRDGLFNEMTVQFVSSEQYHRYF